MFKSQGEKKSVLYALNCDRRVFFNGLRRCILHFVLSDFGSPLRGRFSSGFKDPEIPSQGCWISEMSSVNSAQIHLEKLQPEMFSDKAGTAGPIVVF